MDGVQRHHVNRFMAAAARAGAITPEQLVAHIHADAHRHGDLHRHLYAVTPPADPAAYGTWRASPAGRATDEQRQVMAQSNARTVAGVQPHPLLTAGPPQNIAEHIQIKLKKKAAKKKAPAAKDQGKYLRDLAVKLTGADAKRAARRTGK